ncbi:MAG: diadenylate cyclase CdaA [Eubacteriales bacterium]|nr:diadenylate cyclase CdaA [Eubacteriales bacterium]
MSLEHLQNIIEKFLYRYSLSTIGVSDVVEIIIISMAVYQIITWLQLTRAWTLFKGIIVLLVFALMAAVFQLNTISWLLSNSFSVGIMAAVVIFQPELRRALEQLGRKNLFRNLIFAAEEYSGETTFMSEKTVSEIIKAVYEMSRVKTGALIVIEQMVALGEYERTGIAVDGLVSSQLLINIFEHNTPLHDGAIIIRGGRVVSATCYLPLTDSMELGKELGTRHRAAVGISEVSDSFTIVVSEETGAVSVAREGKIFRDLSRDMLEEKMEFLKKGSTSASKDVLKKWKGLLHNDNEKSEK